MMITRDQIIEHITDGHLKYRGGYPFGSISRNGELIVAKICDDGASSVAIYTEQMLDKWVDDANRFIVDVLNEYGEACDDFEAINDTQPKAINE